MFEKKPTYIKESKDYGKIVSFYKISPVFRVFILLNPYSPRKFIINRFSVVRPICPYVWLPVTPCGSKVMADCCVSHYTSPCFLVGLDIYVVIFFCSTTKASFLRSHHNGSFQLLVLLPYHMGAHVMYTALVVGTCCCWRGPCMALVYCCIGQEMTTEALTICFVLA